MKKSLKIIVTILIIVAVVATSLVIGTPKSYASLGSGARSEGRSNPHPYTPPSSSSSSSSDTTTDTSTGSGDGSGTGGGDTGSTETQTETKQEETTPPANETETQETQEGNQTDEEQTTETEEPKEDIRDGGTFTSFNYISGKAYLDTEEEMIKVYHGDTSESYNESENENGGWQEGAWNGEGNNGGQWNNQNDPNNMQNQPNGEQQENENDLEYDGLTPVRKVLVQVLDSNQNVVASQRTSDDGSFYFSYGDIGSPGTYSLRFSLGDIQGLDSNDDISDALAYNGHDYVIAEMPNGQSDSTSALQQEIARSGKGAEQVFLVIDDSLSTRQTKVKIAGKDKTRLEVEVDAARELISDLLNGGENVYIGIVSFSGESRKICSLTKNENLLSRALDNLLASEPWYSTDIVKALDKANNSFLYTGADSNRTIVMMSDGIPSADEAADCYVYSDDTDDEAEAKMRNILAPNVQKKLSDIRNGIMTKTIEDENSNGGTNQFENNPYNMWNNGQNNNFNDNTNIENKNNNTTQEQLESGAKIMSLIVESNDDEEKEYVNDIYDGNVDKYVVTQDGVEMANAIKDDVKNFITENNSTKDYDDKTYKITGCEDSDRRQVVDDVFDDKIFTYSNSEDESENVVGTAMFESTEKNEENYNRQYAEELSEKTKIWGTSTGYVIQEPLNGPTPGTWTTTDECTETIIENGEEVEHPYKVVTTYINTGYDEQNMKAQQKTALQLATSLTATNLNINLANGQNLYNGSADMSSNQILLCQMDNEVVYGATSNVTYTLTVKNGSSFQCNYLELVCYMPNGYSFNNDLTKEANGNMDDVEITWPANGLDDLKKRGRISDGTYNKSTLKNKECMVLKFDNNNKGNQGFYLPANGKLEMKLVFSKVLSDIDSASPNIEEDGQGITEIIGYKSNGNRRMAYLPVEETSKKDNSQSAKSNISNIFKGIFPGDSKGSDYSNGTNSFEIMNPLGITFLRNLVYYGLRALLAIAIIVFIVALILLNKKQKGGTINE